MPLHFYHPCIIVLQTKKTKQKKDIIQHIITMEPKIRVFRILYNDCCSDYTFDDEFFSDLFIETYQKKFGGSRDDIENYYSTRMDPRVLEIYDLLGEKSNKREEYVYSSLKITYFPIELKKYLDVTLEDGSEMMNVNRLQIYKEFYERVVRNNESVESLKAHYQRLEYVIEKYYKEIMKRKSNFDDENLFVKEDLI